MASDKQKQNRFKPGKSGNPNGRPKGTKNILSKPVREAALALLKDDKYVEMLVRRLRDGTAGRMEVRLWEYAFGAPDLTLNVNNRGSITVFGPSSFEAAITDVAPGSATDRLQPANGSNGHAGNGQTMGQDVHGGNGRLKLSE